MTIKKEVYWGLNYKPLQVGQYKLRVVLLRLIHFLNWPMQANGAEMMRIACVLAVERGLKLSAPIHDTLLIESPNDQINADVAKLKECMSEASEGILGSGKICRVDADIAVSYTHLRAHETS